MSTVAFDQSWSQETNEPRPIPALKPAAADRAFIPISRSNIVAALLGHDLWLNQSQKGQVAEVLNKIGMLRQHQSGVMLNKLSDTYDTFNPDDDTVNMTEASEVERLEKRRVFNSKLKELVTSANYRELSPEELEEVLTNASPDGVHVDVEFQEYEVKLMFYRGESQIKKTRRNISTLFLKRITYEVPAFERLFLAIKFKPEDIRLQELMREEQIDEAKAKKRLRKMRKMLPPSVSTDHIYIKVFKDIPRYDVEMLFPNIRVKMKLMDKVRLGGSAFAGLLTWVVGTASKLLVAVALSPIMLAGALLTGVGGVMYAQIRNIFITRDKYRMQLAQSLYFQNLANNQAALALMVDEAEEEDVKEEALLYVHLLRTPVHMTQIDSLGVRISDFLRKKFGVSVDFDIHDALERLLSSGLVTQSQTGDLRAMPPDEANRHLHDRWCHLSKAH